MAAAVDRADAFPTGIDEGIQRRLVLENEDGLEFLDAHPESGLNLNHFHEGFLLRGLVNCNADLCRHRQTGSSCRSC